MDVSGQDWTYLWNSMWCTIITMTTVGYGDFYPTTHMGRLVGVMACMWGTFVISLMVVSLTISSEFTPQQRKAYDKIMQELDAKANRDKAASVITTSVKFWLYTHSQTYQTQPNPKKRSKLLNKIKRAVKQF